MRIPSDQIHGSPSFHTIVSRREDGTFEARNQSMPSVAPQIGRDEQEAIAKLSWATEKWIGEGCPESTQEK
jgi:hypothetical protein